MLNVFARRLTPRFYGTVSPRGGIGDSVRRGWDCRFAEP